MGEPPNADAAIRASDEQRESVGNLAAGAHLTLEQIARTVVNPRTKKSIGVKTLKRMFRKELERRTEFLALFYKRLYEGVDRAEAWGMRITKDLLVGDKEESKAPNVAIYNKGLQVSFVRSPLSDTGIDPPRDFDLNAGIDYRDMPPSSLALPVPATPKPQSVAVKPPILGTQPDYGPMEMDPIAPRKGWMG
jgi:hypothetical protein